LLLPAPPGSGKSTLCAALVARGWRLLSDELALIDMETGMLLPLPRPISLKNQSIRIIAGFWPEAQMSEVVHDTLKGDVVHVQPPERDVAGKATRATPGWIVLPHYEAGAPTRLTSLGKGKALMHLVDNAFNYSTHGARGFQALGNVIDASVCLDFTYGGDLDDATRRFDELARN